MSGGHSIGQSPSPLKGRGKPLPNPPLKGGRKGDLRMENWVVAMMRQKCTEREMINGELGCSNNATKVHGERNDKWRMELPDNPDRFAIPDNPERNRIIQKETG